tara:strand:- start:768 stop:1202 length:435 start_codon:yes stop_codon:yes gene_type:complete
MSLLNPKNVFEWLNELTYKKSSLDSFEKNSWENFNAYMVHRFVSMYQGYIEIANLAQKFPPTDKKGIYNFYCEMLPRKKMFLRYIKTKTKQNAKELLGPIVKYFECSFVEANEYVNLLNKEDIKEILIKLGINDKEIKKLIKKL